MEFRMIARIYKASFERELGELVKAGWEPLWESFRTEGTPGNGNEGTGKVAYFLLLSKQGMAPARAHGPEEGLEADA
jgi:hypothetical protein